MRKLIIPALLALSLSAQANEWSERKKPVICGPFREIVQTLMQERYREWPLWIGQSSEDSTQFSLFTNVDTGAWTLVQYNKVSGCVLGVGDTSDVVNQGQSRGKD